MSNMSKTWRRFYKIYQEVSHEMYGYGKEYYHTSAIASSGYSHTTFMLDINFTGCDMCMETKDMTDFPIDARLREIASKFAVLQRTDDITTYEELRTEVLNMAEQLRVDALNYKFKPTVGRKIAMAIVENARKQDDPENRVITDTTLSQMFDGVYQVLVTSNCDGWAEDTDKHIGYTLNNNLSLNGKKESDAMKICGESVELLAEVLKKLNKEGEVNKDNIFADSPLYDFAESLACGLLISGDGRRNVSNERKLKTLIPGTTITPGDQDSFGWLVGCINLENGTLCYG